MNETRPFNPELDASQVAFLSKIQPNDTELNLCGYSLGHKSSSAQIQVLKAIPASVTKLNLSGNLLCDYKNLAIMLASLPAGLISLSLCSNYLGYLTGEQLAAAFAAIPNGVSNLFLNFNNYLYLKTNAELAHAFKQIPNSVLYIRLSLDDVWYTSSVFWNRSIADLTQIFAGIQPGVTIDLIYSYFIRNQGLTNKKSIELMNKLKTAAPHLNLIFPEPDHLSKKESKQHTLDIKQTLFHTQTLAKRMMPAGLGLLGLTVILFPFLSTTLTLAVALLCLTLSIYLTHHLYGNELCADSNNAASLSIK